MEELINQLTAHYRSVIQNITIAGKAELNITLNSGADAVDFSQNLQDHLVEILDELTIVKINILAVDGKVVDSFSSNQ